MSTIILSTGYHGKLPIRGDFIHHNLTQEFLSPWDSWLQRVIAKSKYHLDNRWLEFYLVSPVWRYVMVLKTGHAYAGILIPSVDKVGRYFPFTIATSPFDSTLATLFVLQNQPWFKRCESIALDALDEQLNQEQLNQTIQALVPTIERLEKTDRELGFRMTLSSSKKMENSLAQLYHFLPVSRSGNYSFWWTDESETSVSHFLCCKDLPDDNLFTAMLDGDWARTDLLDVNSLFAVNDATVDFNYTGS